MFRCKYCNKIFKGKKGTCPECGKPGDSWEPVQQQAKPPAVTVLQPILQYKLHFDDD